MTDDLYPDTPNIRAGEAAAREMIDGASANLDRQFHLGHAWLDIQTMIGRMAGGRNITSGKRYNEAFVRFFEAHPNLRAVLIDEKPGKFGTKGTAKKVQRAALAKLADNEASIRQWYDTLPEYQRVRLSDAAYIIKLWQTWEREREEREAAEKRKALGLPEPEPKPVEKSETTAQVNMRLQQERDAANRTIEGLRGSGIDGVSVDAMYARFKASSWDDTTIEKLIGKLKTLLGEREAERAKRRRAKKEDR